MEQIYSRFGITIIKQDEKFIMQYDNLYKAFKEEIPEGFSFWEIKEKGNV